MSNEITNFIRQIIDEDLKNGKHTKIITRFPPEPNGYLHIGHSKAINISFGIALDYAGTCHLRFDDTNPEAEDTEYVDSIMEDIRWLGYDWGDKLFYASDYYEKLYEYAELLIRDGKAFVCDLSQEQMRQTRGTLTEPGQNSPYRDRTVEENLDLFRRMKAGEFADGEKSLRAKIDMASPNINMRDPVIYRIKKVPHHRTGDSWYIYPMYDYTHCISDALEGITHSLCSLEFEDHRPLYDWFLDQLPVPCHPRQIEFARLNLTYTVMSKRWLRNLVENKYVSGWDDPRMPTLAGMRRRGFTPEAIRNFLEKIGVSKASSVVDFELLQFCLREDLNLKAKRVMAVLDPLEVVIENYPPLHPPDGAVGAMEGVELLDAENNPEDETMGKRQIPFSRVIYIEKEDFCENPPKNWHRFTIGAEVRLKHAYYVKCEKVEKDADGNIERLICTYDPASRGGWTNDGRKVKGTSHWVSAKHAVKVEVRLYDQLFAKTDPMSAVEAPNTEHRTPNTEHRTPNTEHRTPNTEHRTPNTEHRTPNTEHRTPNTEHRTPNTEPYTTHLNPDSLKVITTCMAEPSLLEAKIGEKYQFLRQGYFCADYDFTPEKPVFNRIVSLKDSFKVQK